MQVDPCRNLRADQWARYVGRHTTAEVIEECARTQLLGPSTLETFESSRSSRNRNCPVDSVEGNNNYLFDQID